MKLKQVAGIVFISAATTLGSLWGYNHFSPNWNLFLHTGFRKGSGELRQIF